MAGRKIKKICINEKNEIYEIRYWNWYDFEEWLNIDRNRSKIPASDRQSNGRIE